MTTNRIIPLVAILAAVLVAAPAADAKRPSERARIHALEKKVAAQNAVIAGLVKRLDRMDAVEACVNLEPIGVADAIGVGFDVAEPSVLFPVSALTFTSEKFGAPRAWMMTRNPYCGPQREPVDFPTP